MDKKLFNHTGEEAGSIVLDDSVFNIEVSEGSLYEAIKNELANLRQGTASTKNRGNVKGSNRKPWRQKGTGNARVGDRKSPLWRKGGVIFGPQPRDYSYSIPKKMKRLAIRSALTLKARAGEAEFKVVKDLAIESAKTKDLFNILKQLGMPEKSKAVLIYSGEDVNLKRSGRNIPNLTLLNSDRLRVHDVFYGKTVFLLEGAAGRLSELYGAK